jgi:hypothetical protein
MSCSIFSEPSAYVLFCIFWTFNIYTRHMLNLQEIQNKTYVECSVNTEQDICWIFRKYRTRHICWMFRKYRTRYIIQHMPCSVFSEHTTYVLFCIFWTVNICLVLYLLNIQHMSCSVFTEDSTYALFCIYWTFNIYLVLYFLNIQHMPCSVFSEHSTYVLFCIYWTFNIW